MDSGESDLVLHQRLGDHVVLVTLNRPAKLNAINQEMTAAIHRIVNVTEAEPQVRVVLLAAAGSRAFCAGADLTQVDPATVAATVAAMDPKGGGYFGFVDAVRNKPWIAVVEGLAYGGGFEICLACDGIVASQNASFALPEVKRSFVAGAGGVRRIHQRLPRNVAFELIMTGEPIDATRAYALGMVNRLTLPGEALAAATQLAGVIAGNAPIAVQQSLAAARDTLVANEEDGRAIVAAASSRVRQTADYREGLSAFLERRPPQWSGQ